METSAVMLYLLKEFDKNDVFGFKDEFERSQCLQWLFFWHGSVRSPHFVLRWLDGDADRCQGQPIEGQLNWFGKLAPQKDQCKVLDSMSFSLLTVTIVAIDRFKIETLRIFGVLELQLSGKHTGEEKHYLSGNGKGKYSVADIAAWRKFFFALSFTAENSQLGCRDTISRARSATSRWQNFHICWDGLRELDR